MWKKYSRVSIDNITPAYIYLKGYFTSYSFIETFKVSKKSFKPNTILSIGKQIFANDFNKKFRDRKLDILKWAPINFN